MGPQRGRCKAGGCSNGESSIPHSQIDPDHFTARGPALFDEGISIANSPDLGDSWLQADDLRKEAAYLRRQGDNRADQLWEEAEDTAGSLWIGWFWQHND